MLFDADHVFINGESFHAGGKDAQLMRNLANARALSAAEVRRLSAGARALMEDWSAVGWLHPDD
jgi:50S ribosomal protein L16 3-hydroxylase